MRATHEVIFPYQENSDYCLLFRHPGLPRVSIQVGTRLLPICSMWGEKRLGDGTAVWRWSSLNKNKISPLQVDILPFDLESIRVKVKVSEWKWCPSHVWRTWATSVPILVFPGLSVVDLGPMYTTDRQTSDASSLNAPCPRGGIY